MMGAQIVCAGGALDLGADVFLVGAGPAPLPLVLALLLGRHARAVQRARYHRLREVFIRNGRDKIKDLARQRAHEIRLSVGAPKGPRPTDKVNQPPEVALDECMPLLPGSKA